MKHELALVQPALTVALGATAVASLSGYRGPLKAIRGRQMQTGEGRPLFATVHPSYLLRLPDEAAKAEEYTQFVSDLRAAQALALNLRGGDGLAVPTGVETRRVG